MPRRMAPGWGWSSRSHSLAAPGKTGSGGRPGRGPPAGRQFRQNFRGQGGGRGRGQALLAQGCGQGGRIRGRPSLARVCRARCMTSPRSRAGAILGRRISERRPVSPQWPPIGRESSPGRARPPGKSPRRRASPGGRRSGAGQGRHCRYQFHLHFRLGPATANPAGGRSSR